MKMSLISLEKARKRLPKIGDRLVLAPTHYDKAPPEPCIVDYVHTKHRWYRVQFISSGIRNCYKVP